jgi:hypothetical protein
MTEGFYKKDGEELLYAPNIVEGNGFVLVKQDKDQYEYPIEGWKWFESEEEAIDKLSIINISPASIAMDITEIT